MRQSKVLHSASEVLASDSDSDADHDAPTAPVGRLLFQGQLSDTERQQVEAMGGLYTTLARGLRAGIWQRVAAADSTPSTVEEDHHLHTCSSPDGCGTINGTAGGSALQLFDVAATDGEDETCADLARGERLHAVSLMRRSLRSLHRRDHDASESGDDDDASPRRCARIEVRSSPVRYRESSSRLSGVVDGALSVRRSSQRLEKSTSCAAAYFGSPESPAAHATEQTLAGEQRGDSIMKISRNLLDAQFETPTPHRSDRGQQCASANPRPDARGSSSGITCTVGTGPHGGREDVCGSRGGDDGMWPRLLQHCNDSKVVVPLMSPVSPDLLACCAGGNDLASSFAIYLSSSGPSSSENSQASTIHPWGDDSDSALQGALDAILTGRAC